MHLGPLPVWLLSFGLLLAVLPFPADGTRAELGVGSGGQSMAQMQERLSDPEQRPHLEKRPLCWPPVMAPFTYMQDSALRHGCAGPNARSMSLAVLLLAGAAGLMTTRRWSAREPAPAPRPGPAGP